MTDFQKYDPATHPEIKKIDDYNSQVDHAFEKPFKFLVRKNGSNYEAIYGRESDQAGKIFGSATSTSLHTCVNEVLANGLTAGRTWMEKVVLVGDLTAISSITVPSYVYLQILGRISISTTLFALPSGTTEVVIDNQGKIIASPISNVVSCNTVSKITLKNGIWEKAKFAFTGNCSNIDILFTKCYGDQTVQSTWLSLAGSGATYSNLNIIFNKVYDYSFDGIVSLIPTLTESRIIGNEFKNVTWTNGDAINIKATKTIIALNRTENINRSSCLLSNGTDCLVVLNEFEDGASVDRAAATVKFNKGYITEGSGQTGWTGDGVNDTFSFPHNLSTQPTVVKLTPYSPDATEKHYISGIDGTDVYVTFLTPPADQADIQFLYEVDV